MIKRVNFVRFNQVSLNATATISDDGKHLSRVLSFNDGHQKIVGVLLGGDGSDFVLNIDGKSSERIEISEGECQVQIGENNQNDEQNHQYYRAGQSFVVESGMSLIITVNGTVQYIRHLEG